MKLYFVIMLGGALGSAARFGLASVIDGKWGTLPWGTFTVNVLGSFLVGFFMALAGPDGPFMASPVTRAFVAIGILGGFTTFSSFSLQTIMLLQDGEWLWAAGNVLLTVTLCLLATAGGIALAGVLPLRS